MDERTERLINRRLDGELTDDESLELDKLLIRSPEARARQENYERTDALAGAALHAFFDRPAQPPVSADQLAMSPARGRARAARALSAGAAVAAALILAVLLAGPPAQHAVPAAEDDPRVANADRPETFAAAVPSFDQPPVSIIEGPRRRTERVLRDVFGVFDDRTQSLYLLELDESRTRVTPVSMDY